MANLQVKDVPSDLHDGLRELARREGRPMRDIVLDAVRRELEHRAFVRRLAERSRVELERPAWQEVEEARAERGDLLDP